MCDFTTNNILHSTTSQMRQQVSIQALTNMVNVRVFCVCLTIDIYFNVYVTHYFTHTHTHTQQTMTQKCFEKCITKPGESLSSREQRCLDACVKNYQNTMMKVKSAVENSASS